LDYQRQPKAGFYALQTAMQPVLPSIDAPLPAHLDGQRWLYPDTLEKLTFALWIINDTLANYDNAQLNWRIERNDGQIVLSEAVQIDIRADEARRQATLRNISLPLGIYQLSVGLENAQGQSLGHNVLDFAIVDAEELAKESVTKPAEETEEASSPSESSSRLVPFDQPRWIGIGCYWPLNIPCR
jgi:beta-mannosidase